MLPRRCVKIRIVKCKHGCDLRDAAHERRTDTDLSDIRNFFVMRHVHYAHQQSAFSSFPSTDTDAGWDGQPIESSDRMPGPGLLQVPRVAERSALSWGHGMLSQQDDDIPLAFGGSMRGTYDSEDDEIDLEDSKESDGEEPGADEDDDGQDEYVPSYETAWVSVDDDDVAIGSKTTRRGRQKIYQPCKAHHTWEDLPRFWVEYFNFSQQNDRPTLLRPQDGIVEGDARSSFVPLAQEELSMKEESDLIHRPVEVPFPFCQRFENEGVCNEPTCGLYVSGGPLSIAGRFVLTPLLAHKQHDSFQPYSSNVEQLILPRVSRAAKTLRALGEERAFSQQGLQASTELIVAIGELQRGCLVGGKRPRRSLGDLPRNNLFKSLVSIASIKAAADGAPSPEAASAYEDLPTSKSSTYPFLQAINPTMAKLLSAKSAAESKKAVASLLVRGERANLANASRSLIASASSIKGTARLKLPQLTVGTPANQQLREGPPPSSQKSRDKLSPNDTDDPTGPSSRRPSALEVPAMMRTSPSLETSASGPSARKSVNFAFEASEHQSALRRSTSPQPSAGKRSPADAPKAPPAKRAKVLMTSTQIFDLMTKPSPATSAALLLRAPLEAPAPRQGSEDQAMTDPSQPSPTHRHPGDATSTPPAQSYTPGDTIASAPAATKASKDVGVQVDLPRQSSAPDATAASPPKVTKDVGVQVDAPRQSPASDSVVASAPTLTKVTRDVGMQVDIPQQPSAPPIAAKHPTSNPSTPSHSRAESDESVSPLSASPHAPSQLSSDDMDLDPPPLVSHVEQKAKPPTKIAGPPVPTLTAFRLRQEDRDFLQRPHLSVSALPTREQQEQQRSSEYKAVIASDAVEEASYGLDFLKMSKEEFRPLSSALGKEYTFSKVGTIPVGCELDVVPTAGRNSERSDRAEHQGESEPDLSLRWIICSVCKNSGHAAFDCEQVGNDFKRKMLRPKLKQAGILWKARPKCLRLQPVSSQNRVQPNGQPLRGRPSRPDIVQSSSNATNPSLIQTLPTQTRRSQAMRPVPPPHVTPVRASAAVPILNAVPTTSLPIKPQFELPPKPSPLPNAPAALRNPSPPSIISTAPILPMDPSWKPPTPPRPPSQLPAIVPPTHAERSEPLVAAPAISLIERLSVTSQAAATHSEDSRQLAPKEMQKSPSLFERIQQDASQKVIHSRPPAGPAHAFISSHPGFEGPATPTPARHSQRKDRTHDRVHSSDRVEGGAESSASLLARLGGQAAFGPVASDEDVRQRSSTNERVHPWKAPSAQDDYHFSQDYQIHEAYSYPSASHNSSGLYPPEDLSLRISKAGVQSQEYYDPERHQARVASRPQVSHHPEPTYQHGFAPPHSSTSVWDPPEGPRFHHIDLAENASAAVSLAARLGKPAARHRTVSANGYAGHHSGDDHRDSHRHHDHSRYDDSRDYSTETQSHRSRSKDAEAASLRSRIH